MKKKIFVIFTGGTIGSASADGRVGLDGQSRKKLIDMYKAERGDDVEFICSSPVNMLSENVGKEQLYAIHDAVRALNFSAADGIIITHGTDSLCINAHYLALTLCDIPLPVVLVSSLYPLDDERQNGLINFCAAVDFIEKSGARGVFVSFANCPSRPTIHLAGRLTFCDQLTGFYHSAKDVPLAEICGGEVKFIPSPLNPTQRELSVGGREPAKREISDRVMLITARSLLNFSLYDFDRVRPEAVIIETYHSGTVCTEGDELNFLKFAAYCRERGVAVILAPIDSGANVYASMSNLPDNVITATDECLESAIAKVMCALGARLSPDAYFKKNIAFEKLNLQSPKKGNL